MKKFILFLCVCCASAAQAKLGCMDKSQHGDISDGYDYKALHYVECSCPCDRYPRLESRGQCLQCKHYSIPHDPF